MMYSAEAKPLGIALKQYLYKFKSFSFLGLIILQLITLFFSSGGIGMYGSGSGTINLTVRNYTGDIVIISTMIWAFAVAIILTKKQARDIDFTLVSNRFTSGLSDLGIIVTISAIGALTSILSGMLLRVLMYFTLDHSTIISSSFKLPVSDLFQGFLAISLYTLLVSAGGYFFGMLLEVSRLFVFIIPALLLGLARGQNSFFLDFLRFYITETSLFLFAAKVLLTTAVFFALSMLIYNRKEVRR